MDEPKTLHVPGRLLQACGQALYGDVWQYPLSRLLGHSSPRTVQRWAEASREDRSRPVSVTLLRELLGHLEAKAGPLMRTHDALKELYDGR